jgi:uncharacterized membrane protein YidH (DUF202 family)
MAKLTFRTWTYPVALFVLILVSYGVLSPWLGFYWDDWPSIWYLHILGPGGFPDVFSIDRPLLGRLFMLTTSLIGETTLGWQIFGIITRWGSSVALWWTLRSLWPEHEQEVAWTAFLFALYPGFTQQYISVTYSHVFLVMTFFLLSLGGVIWALRKNRWFWPLTLVSLSASAFSLFSVEYFFGLEFLRPVIIWIVLSERVKARRERLVKTLTHWLPYLATIAIFLTWRILLQTTPRGQVLLFDRLQSGATTLLGLIKTILSDVVESGLLAWLQTIDPRRYIDFGLTPSLASIGMMLLVAGVSLIYLLYFKAENHSSTDLRPASRRVWSTNAILIGLYALVIAGWPFWATHLPIRLGFPWDRFNLAMMLGSSLLLAGIITLAGRSRLQKIILIGVMVGLAAGFHFYQAEKYRREWDRQKALFWQLLWRAPQIEPGTTLLTSQMPFIFYSDNSLTAPLNWIYASDSDFDPLDYLLVDIEARLGNKITGLEPGLAIDIPYRVTSFHGSTSQAIVLFYSPPRCLKILNAETDILLPHKPGSIPSALPLSKVELIGDGGDLQKRPPEHIFGPEPEHGWCYYFEKADLASQEGKWQDIVDMGNALFDPPASPSETGLRTVMDMMADYNQEKFWEKTAELVPFIQGYAHAGLWSQAEQLTLKAYSMAPKLKYYLCSTWEGIQAGTSSDQEQTQAVNNIIRNLNCSFE